MWHFAAYQDAQANLQGDGLPAGQGAPPATAGQRRTSPVSSNRHSTSHHIQALLVNVRCVSSVIDFSLRPPQIAPQISELSAASASTGQCKQKEVKTPPPQQQRQARRVSPEEQGRARSRRSLTASPAVSPAKVLTAKGLDSPAKSAAGSGGSASPSPQKRGRTRSVPIE